MTPEMLAGRVLILGYGNPGRQDDGLGPAAALVIEKLALPGVKVEINYQLNIEDAAEAALFDHVIFVDADESGPEPFSIRDVLPSAQTSFTSHLVQPGVVLGICRDCYGRSPQGHQLAIRGHEFELKEELTERGRANLEQAVAHLRALLGA
jgi:hydrogenase maturation protease